MELDSVRRMVSVLDRHDDPFRRARRHLDLARHVIRFDHERMISTGAQRRRKSVEESAPFVEDLARLAMERRHAAHLAAERDPDRLMAEADAEDRELAREASDRLDRDARVLRSTRPRRDDEAARSVRSDAVDVDRVVPNDAGARTELADELDEVVGERVVVVDDEDHLRLAPPLVAASARRIAS